MKKIIISLLLCLFLTPLAAFSNNNFIYSINVTRDDALEYQVSPAIKLEIKSDYKTDIKNKTDEMGREYFDIKDASLKENFAIRYNNVNGIESVIAQQIGNKVRIYVTGNSVGDINVVFNNVENQPYPDKSAGYALLVFAFIICVLFGAFKRKAKNIKVNALKEKITDAKLKALQNNTASRTVYNNLMEQRTSSRIYDNRNLTLNALSKTQGRKTIKTIAEHQRIYAQKSKVAM